MSALARKLAIAAVGIAFAALSGREFYAHRHLREPVVLGPGVTAVRTLGDYFPGIRGTENDAHVYVLEGREPGGTVLVLGGTHPEEPGGRLAAWVFIENARPEKGRIIVIPSANRSGTTVTRAGGAYPYKYTIPTAWGGQTFRMGDRWSSALDQWPDPEVYVHYPTRQQLAYVDIRNLNRAFPGRPGGTFTERTTFAIMELIRKEKVDVEMDLHEAELQYPVISAIVAHEKGQDVAAMASMMISDFKMGIEPSPKALRGLSHREVGDHSDAVSLLFEAPEPFLDATRGRTDAAMLLSGKDDFVVRAGKRGLLFEKIDAKGWPIEVRVARHCATIQQVLEVWAENNPDRAVALKDVPAYAEVVSKGVGAFLKDPSKAPPDRLLFE